MQRQVNQEEARVIWGLDRWYEKTIYVLGYIILVFWALAIVIGFITGIVESVNTDGTVQPSYTETQ